MEELFRIEAAIKAGTYVKPADKNYYGLPKCPHGVKYETRLEIYCSCAQCLTSPGENGKI